MPFNLLTTVDSATLQRLPAAGFLRRLLTWRTVFFGTTVSEYVPMLPTMGVHEQIRAMLAYWSASTRLMIIKDIPEDSPLLLEAERAIAADCLQSCRNMGFVIVAGQALAYVPIDFASEADYLARLSPSRRKNIRRKLKSRAGLKVEIVKTGCLRLQDGNFLAELYALYEEVYAQSTLQFDKLTASFFTAVLQDDSLDGHLFLYSSEHRLIGYNLCFVHNGMLIDKYIGFRYPAARDHNLYIISWMENLRFSLEQGLTHYIAGWTDPEIKADLGAKFTFTYHAVYARSGLFRRLLQKFSGVFEHDKAWFEERQR
jgi:predicted N-acyltransferase